MPFRNSVIVKDDKELRVEQEKPSIVGNEIPAHLTFRRLAVHDFSVEPENEPVRFYYRGHSKHLAPGSVA